MKRNAPKKIKPQTPFAGLGEAVGQQEPPVTMTDVQRATEQFGKSCDHLNGYVNDLEALVQRAREAFFGKELHHGAGSCGEALKTPEGLIPRLSQQLNGSVLAVGVAGTRVDFLTTQLRELFERLGVTLVKNEAVR